VTSTKRSPMMPDVPTFAEAGTPLDVSVWIGIAAPAGTPTPIVEKLNAEFNKALAAPDVKAKFASLGVDPIGGTTAQMTQYVKSDVERWAKIIKSANIKIE